MSEIPTTTSNGHKIENPTEVASAEDFKRRMSDEYLLEGESPAERLDRLKELSVEGVAILLEDINKSIQGSSDSLMAHDKTMKIGKTETLKPEDRYDVFLKLVEDIKNAPEDINPARVGDALALGVILLHPFHDGNGRTARVLGFMFRDMFDNPDTFEADYNVTAAPRDKARENGGMIILGYTPQFPEGFDQSNPSDVSAYLHDVMTKEAQGSYYSCYSNDAEPLKAPIS